jgi:hypothetical protein
MTVREEEELLKREFACFYFIFNGVEEEAAGGGCGASEGAVVGSENCGYFFEVHVATGDVEHGADQVANHVVEESIAADAIDEEMEAVGRLLVPRGGVNGADGGAGFQPSDQDLSLGTLGLRLDCGVCGGIVRAGGEIGIGGGEAAEVVFAKECCGDCVEGSKI